MDARDLFTRHGKHAERIVLAQIAFDREWKTREIRERAAIFRHDVRGVERVAIMRNVVVGVLERPAQARKLQRFDFVATGDLDCIQTRRCSLMAVMSAPVLRRNTEATLLQPALRARLPTRLFAQPASAVQRSRRFVDHFAFDAIRLAAKQRDQRAVLIVDVDIIDTRTPSRAALARDGGEYVSFAARR